MRDKKSIKRKQGSTFEAFYTKILGKKLCYRALVIQKWLNIEKL